MFSFFSRPAFGGDPASEMEAFIDHRQPAKVQAQAAQAPEVQEYEVGRIVGRRGSNFLVKVGDEVREVPPTGIERVIHNG